MKKFIYSMLAFLFVLPLMLGLAACGKKEGVSGVKTVEEFLAKFDAEASVTLGANLKLEENLNVDKDFVIDLNNYTLTFDGNNQNLVYVNAGRNVTIKNGKIRYTSEVDPAQTMSCITNFGNLTVEKVDLKFDNLNVQNNEEPHRLDGFANWGEGALVIRKSVITMNIDDTTRNYKTCGVFSLGRSFVFENSVLTMNCSANSSYGIYNYINVGEENPGTRTATITGSTVNLTSNSINSISGIFAESYVSGEENVAKVIIGQGTRVNVTRTAESGSGKKTYALRAKGNATISGANNATLTIVDVTDCTQYERGMEAGEAGTGVITD